MTSRKPFSPYFAIDKTVKRYGCYIDIDGKPFTASWTGSLPTFDFTDISDIRDFQLCPLALSDEKFSLWNLSELLGYGTHACVRLKGTDAYPVFKIAHPGVKPRRWVEREFKIMRALSESKAVARVADEPLTDETGIFGFRLQRLYPTELDELQKRFQEVAGLLETLHQAGYCHGDCSPSNIMQDVEGTLVLIDLAFAGRLGDKIPKDAPKYMFTTDVYTVEIDQRRIAEWAQMIAQ